ncbi:MFS transporter [Tepidibacter formicigenes]|nr:MFS transporter [Tepidibacter formicigenes]
MRFTRIINILFVTQYIKFNLIQYAMLQSVFSLSQFIMEVPSGFLSDYFKKKTVTIAGLVMSAVTQIIICSSLVLNSASPFWILTFAYMIEGFARAFISGSDEALFYEKIKECNLEKSYEKIIGRGQLISSISVGMATFLGGVMYAYDIKMPYLMQTIFTLISAGIVLSVKEIKPDLEKEVIAGETGQLKKMFGEFNKVRRNYQAIFMMFFISFTFAIINTIFGIMPNYLAILGFNSSENGMVFMLLSFIGGIVATHSYRLSKLRFGDLVTITCMMMCGGLLFILIGGDKIVIFIGLTLFYIIIDLLNPIAMKAFNSYVSNDIRATFLSMVSFITTAMTMSLYPLSGYIVEKNGMHTLLTFTVITTVSLLTVAFIVYKSFSSKYLNNNMEG